MKYGDWQYTENIRRKIIICNSKKGIDYHNACDECEFSNGEYGDHWTTDKVWCSAPVEMHKGDKILIQHIERYKIARKKNENKSKR